MSLTKVNYIDNSTIITAKNLNDIQDNIIQNAELIKKVAPRNLLDNSDFTNPVNQRGFVSGTGGQANYTIDRWWLQYDTNLYLYSDCIGLSSFWDLRQCLGCKITTGTTLTFAVMAKSEAATGNVFLSINNTTNSHGREIRDSINNIEWKTIVGHWTADRDYDIGEVKFILGINTGNELTTQIYYKCPVVYEGEYTAETLPEYQPKGYGVELAECQRYYLKLQTASQWSVIHNVKAGYLMLILPIPSTFRTTPSIVANPNGTEIYAGAWQPFDATLMSIRAFPGCIILQSTTTIHTDITFTEGMSYLMNHLPSLSADL